MNATAVEAPVAELYQAEYWRERAQLEVADHEACGWGSEASQVLRHNVALGKLGTIRPGQTLLDWGCGTCRLADRLPLGVTYVGADPSPEMRERARVKRKRQVCELHAEKPLDTFDYVVAIGAWNLQPWTVDRTVEAITELWQSTACSTLVASLLRRPAGGDVPEDHIAYDPASLALLASTLAPRWEIDAGYMPNDFALVLYR